MLGNDDSAQVWGTYDLELNRDNAEVEHLDRGPDEEVRLECRHVDVLKLASHGTSAAALGDCHECEEASETWRDVSFLLWQLYQERQIQDIPTGANKS